MNGLKYRSVRNPEFVSIASFSSARGLPLDLGRKTVLQLASALPGITNADLSEPLRLMGGGVFSGLRDGILAPTFQTPEGDAFYSGGESLSFGPSGVQWRASAGVDNDEIAFRLAATMQIHCGTLSHRSNRFGSRQSLLSASMKERLAPIDIHKFRKSAKTSLLGVAPVQWFGPAFVEAFGGDEVFESLPDGWAEKVAPDLWKVFGVDREAGDLDSFSVKEWSDRERALIEALGSQFFFNVETGDLATEFIENRIATRYPVYLWDEDSQSVVIHETDGSIRQTELDVESAISVADEASLGPPDMAPLVVQRMTEVVGDLFVDDDQLYWVELHLEMLQELEDVWIEAFSIWLGEHVKSGILDAEWVQQNGRWAISSSRGVFDPGLAIRATVGSKAQGQSRVLVSAACDAMGIPLP